MEWLKTNEKAIKDMLPETWTHIENLNGLQLGYKIKLLGVDWRSEDDFGHCMDFFEKVGFMLRDGHLIKRNPINIF